VYHVELRQFPHNLCRFNLSEEELVAGVVGPWSREEWIELGERKWSPHQARLTVLEGPHIPVEQLSMGRGWRSAQREGRDVTERVIAAVRAGDAGRAAQAPMPVAPTTPDAGMSLADARMASDSLGLELLGVLGGGQSPLAQVWRLAGARFPERPASECLALAELAVRSLLGAGLVVLFRADHEQPARPVGEEEIEPLLRAVASWTGEPGSTAVWVRRA
jgi:hypothetical protein